MLATLELPAADARATAAETIEPATSWPVGLVCPACRRALTTGRCSCAAGTRLAVEHGIPRLLFGQKYWGEADSATMARLLERCESVHWRDALAEVAGGEPVHQHLTAPVGADIVHAFPWGEIDTVLDIGAGMGFIAAEMARYGKTIVALEAVPERARFLKIRAEQDGLDIRPVIANGLAPPFADGSFDLITMNGVFEYAGLWGEGDPERVQQDFLARLMRLLKPNGYLYIGIETRFGYAMLAGGRDHSGMAYTSLLPRKVADLVCRMRAKPFFGAEHTVGNYRTYTYTPAHYERMLRKAGFAAVQVQGAFDGYNRQVALYGLEEPGLRRAILEAVARPSSRLGRLRHAVTSSRPLYRTLESEVVVFARKSAGQTPLLWSTFAKDGAIGQINTASKIILASYARGAITSVAEAGKAPVIADRLRHGFGVLQATDQTYGVEAAKWPLRWCRPLGTAADNGRTFYRYEFIPGPTLMQAAMTLGGDEPAIAELFDIVLDHYPALCDRIVEATGAAPAAFAATASTMIDPSFDDELRRRCGEAIERAVAKGWRTATIHGDLSGDNIIVTAAGQLVLIDWEHVSERHLPEIDLIRLYYDLLVEADRRQCRPLLALAPVLRERLAATLATRGFAPADMTDLEYLFLMHQAGMVADKSGSVSHLAETIRSGRFAIGGEH